MFSSTRVAKYISCYHCGNKCRLDIAAGLFSVEEKLWLWGREPAWNRRAGSRVLEPVVRVEFGPGGTSWLAAGRAGPSCCRWLSVPRAPWLRKHRLSLTIAAFGVAVVAVRRGSGSVLPGKRNGCSSVFPALVVCEKHLWDAVAATRCYTAFTRLMDVKSGESGSTH